MTVSRYISRQHSTDLYGLSSLALPTVDSSSRPVFPLRTGSRFGPRSLGAGLSLSRYHESIRRYRCPDARHRRYGGLLLSRISHPRNRRRNFRCAARTLFRNRSRRVRGTKTRVRFGSKSVSRRIVRRRTRDRMIRATAFRPPTSWVCSTENRG